MFLNNKSIFGYYAKLHGFHDNPLGNFKDMGVPTKILIIHQQLMLKHSTWYQINLWT